MKMSDEHPMPLLGVDHTRIELPYDNSDGSIPHVTKGSRGHFVSPVYKFAYESNLRKENELAG